jgi:transcription elongation factor Elf1
MDHDDASVISCMSIVCPHCNGAEPDDFEVLDLDELRVMNCDACQRKFHLMIVECEGCGQESVLTWIAVPMPSDINLAACVHCGNLFTDHGSDIRTMGQGR